MAAAATAEEAAAAAAAAARAPSDLRSWFAAGHHLRGAPAQFLYGGVAGAVGKTLGAPLARLVILMQTGGAEGSGVVGAARSVFAREGLRGFFRGNLVDVMRGFNQNGINYILYEKVKEALLPWDTSSTGAVARLAAGGVSGVIAVGATYPLDLVRTRLGAQTRSTQYTGTLDAFKKIWRADGVHGLYVGCFATLVETFPSLAINYAVFELARNTCADAGRVGFVYSLGSGVFAALCATFTTFPLDSIRRNVQIGGGVMYTSIIDCTRCLHRKGGLRLFYKGMVPAMTRNVPVAGTTFATYDYLKRVAGMPAT